MGVKEVKDHSSPKEPDNGTLDITEGMLTALPSWFADAKYMALRELSLKKNAFLQPPPEVLKLKKLTRLNLTANQLSSLEPNCLPTALQVLELTNNQISRIDPTVLPQLKALFSLNLTANHLDTAALEAAQLDKAKSIETLVLSNNRLTELPSLPPKLIELNASLNPLSGPPTSLIRLKASLQRLLLARCGLREVPEELVLLSSLAELHLQRNHLKIIPAGIGGCVSLRHIDVGYNLLLELPPELGQCRSLIFLDASYNQITAFPESIVGCPLDRLFLQSNQITGLPASAAKLFTSNPNAAGLECLLDNNNISVVGPGMLLSKCTLFTLGHNPIDSLSGLDQMSAKDINLGFLSLTELPTLLDGVETFAAPANRPSSLLPSCVAAAAKSLKILNLSQNSLSELPPEIGNLRALQHLLVGYNQLSTLPPTFKDLKDLTILHIGGNR